MKVDYEFLRMKDGHEVYSTNIEDLLSPENRKAKGLVYEVCPVCQHKHELGIDGFYLDPHYDKRKLGVFASRTAARCNRCGSIFIDDSGSMNIRIPELNFSLGVIRSEIDITVLPEVEQVLRHASELNERELEVLKARNPNLDPKKLGLKTLRSWDRPNILAPFYLMGTPVYYQLRFLDHEAPKYFNPSIKNKPIYIPKGCNFSRKIVICEGVYDAIACMSLYPDRMPVAIIGSDLTPYNVNLIRKLITPEDVLVRMDSTKFGEKIAKMVNESPISYISGEADVVEIDTNDPKGIDPEEYLRSTLGLPLKIDIAEIYENYVKR